MGVYHRPTNQAAGYLDVQKQQKQNIAIWRRNHNVKLEDYREK